MRYFLRMMVWFLLSILLASAFLLVTYFIFGPIESKVVGIACGILGGISAFYVFDPEKTKEWR